MCTLRKSVRSAIRHTTTLAAIACVLAAAPVAAGKPDLSALGGARPVADEELADMRGKFVTPQSVSFFGITMLTSWQDASGGDDPRAAAVQCRFSSPAAMAAHRCRS